MHRVRFAVLSLIVLLATVVPAMAGYAPVLDRILDRGEMRVGMSGTQAPFNVVSKSGDLIGIDVELAKLIASAIDVDAKLVQKPFGELLDLLEEGKVDMVISGLTITAERNTRFAFVGPYMVSGKSILTTTAKVEQLDSLENMNTPGVRLAVLEKSTSQSFVELLIPEATMVATRDHDAAVKLVLDGKADAVVADMPVCLLAALRHPNAGLTTLTEPFTVEPIGIAVPPNDPLLMNLLDNYLEALEMQGVLEALRTRWFDDGSWLIQVP